MRWSRGALRAAATSQPPLARRNRDERDFLPDVLSVLHLEQRQSVAQFVEQRPGVLQVGGVEALSEPVIDFRKRCARSLR